MINIIGACEGSSGVKYFSMPGVEVRADCPKCKEPVTEDMPCFSYPNLGTPFTWGLYCSSCGHEWEFKVQIDVILKVIED